MKDRGQLHLVIGPVGAGKSTFAHRRSAAARAVFLDLDTWMVRLYGDDPRPPEGVLAWYLERRERCRAVLWDTARSILECGTDVYLELGLVRRAERESLCRAARIEDLDLRVYLVDAPRDLRRERVRLRNHSAAAHVQVVPPEFFEAASDAWEPPSLAEQHEWDMIIV